MSNNIMYGSKSVKNDSESNDLHQCSEFENSMNPLNAFDLWKTKSLQNFRRQLND